jgi:hypothetical protein
MRMSASYSNTRPCSTKFTRSGSEPVPANQDEAECAVLRESCELGICHPALSALVATMNSQALSSIILVLYLYVFVHTMLRSLSVCTRFYLPLVPSAHWPSSTPLRSSSCPSLACGDAGVQLDMRCRLCLPDSLLNSQPPPFSCADSQENVCISNLNGACALTQFICIGMLCSWRSCCVVSPKWRLNMLLFLSLHRSASQSLVPASHLQPNTKPPQSLPFSPVSS